MGNIPQTALSADLVPGVASMAIAMSQDGRRLCALTEEDEEYWIVVHHFPAGRCAPHMLILGDNPMLIFSGTQQPSGTPSAA